MRDVYINGLGCVLPGEPVGNHDIEDRIGRIGGLPCEYKSLILRQNRIKTRHYALDRAGEPTHCNSEMAAKPSPTRSANPRLPPRIFPISRPPPTIGDLMVPGLADRPR